MLTNSEIDKMKNDQLKQTLKTAVLLVKQQETTKETTTTSITDLLQKFQADNKGYFKQLNDRLDVITEVIKKDLHKEFDPQLTDLEGKCLNLQTIVSKQQAYIEQLDAAQRANNVIISGIPEEQEMTYQGTSASNDLEKCQLVLSAVGCTPDVKDVCRLGQRNEADRPIKLTLRKPSDRPDILSKTNGLYAMGPFLKNIRVKKDSHPAVRKEWTRLHDRMRAEKSNLENAGHQIRMDYKTRELLRDDNAIDSFRNPFI